MGGGKKSGVRVLAVLAALASAIWTTIVVWVNVTSPDDPLCPFDGTAGAMLAWLITAFLINAAAA